MTELSLMINVEPIVKNDGLKFQQSVWADCEVLNRLQYTTHLNLAYNSTLICISLPLYLHRLSAFYTWLSYQESSISQLCDSSDRVPAWNFSAQIISTEPDILLFELS